MYFAHHQLYHPKRFISLTKELDLTVDTLCISEKGREVPCVLSGNGDKYIILTARHHCCESTGSYILEGVLSSLAKDPIDGYSFLCVPFVDYDGVLDGDQGKNRIPYDHNRDYDITKTAIYNSVRAIRNFAVSHNTVFGFDFHSPWHKGGINDKVFIPQKSIEKLNKMIKFGQIFESCCDENCLEYKQENDLAPNVDWNKVPSPCFGSFIFTLDTADIGFTLETPYFGKDKAKFCEQKAIKTGENFANALRNYIKSTAQTAKISFTGDLIC